MPACPKCGYPQATVLNCPKCKATFARPLVIGEEPKQQPAPSPALGKEVLLDRRSAPRDGSSLPTAKVAAVARPAAPPAPAAADDSWMKEPGESKPPFKPAPKPTAPPPRAASPLASRAAALSAPGAAAAETPRRPSAPSAAPAPAPAANRASNEVTVPHPAGAPGTTARLDDKTQRFGAPAAPALASQAPAETTERVPDRRPATPSLIPETLSASAARAASPEPEFERAPLPRPEDQGPGAISMPPAPAPFQPATRTEPGTPEFPTAGARPAVPRPEAAEGPAAAPAQAESPPAAGPPPAVEPALVAFKTGRSMAVQSAEIPEEEIHAEPGGAFAQVGAGIVDAVLLGLLFAGYLAVAQAIAGRVPASTETGVDWLIERAVTWQGVLAPGAVLLGALWFVYGSLFHALGGRTLGKRIFGLTVVDRFGVPPRLARSAVRSLLSFFSAGLLFMGFVLVLFDARRQALHDKLSGTFVVHLAD